MKRTLMIFGAIFVAALLAAGSFWGGVAYQTNRAEQARANFMNARGQANGGQLPAGGQGQGFFGGRGTTGEVKTIEGNVMTVSTAQDVITVNLSESTQIEKAVSGTIDDLQPGLRVMVTGQRDNDGNITASQVTILNNNPSGTADGPMPPDPNPTGTEP